MSHYRQNPKFKSFSNENFTDVKEREFLLLESAVVRTRSDGEVVKASDNNRSTQRWKGVGLYCNSEDSVMTDSTTNDASSSLRLFSSRTSQMSENEDYTWVVISDVDTDSEPETSCTVSVKDSLEPSKSRKNLNSVSSLVDVLRKIRFDFENAVISSSPTRSREDLTHEEDTCSSAEICKDIINNGNAASKRIHDDHRLVFIDDHYTQNETTLLLCEDNDAMDISDSKEVESIEIGLSNMDTIKENIDQSSECVTRDINGKENDIYFDVPPKLVDNCSQDVVNLYLQLTRAALSDPDSAPTDSPVHHPIVKPVALHANLRSREDNIAELGINVVTKRDEYIITSDGLGTIDVGQNRSKNYTVNDEDEIELIHLSPCSSCYESHTPSPEDKPEEDQIRAGLAASADCKLSSDFDYVEWTLCNTVKEMTGDDRSFQNDESTERRNKCYSHETLSAGNRPTVINTTLSKSKENESDLDKHLSYHIYVDATCREFDIARYLSNNEVNTTNLLNECVSDTSKSNFTDQNKDISPGEIYVDSQSCKVATSLNRDGVDDDLIKIFTYDAVSSSHSSISSRETNEEADREVADIMAHDSEDYVIDFKNETSSSDEWSVSSADSDVASVTPELLHDHPTKECSIEETYGEDGNVALLLQESNIMQNPTDMDTRFGIKSDILEGVKSAAHEQPGGGGGEGTLILNENIYKIDSTRNWEIDQSIDLHNIDNTSINTTFVAKTEPPKETLDRNSTFLKVSSQTLLQKLPVVHDLLPSDFPKDEAVFDDTDRKISLSEQDLHPSYHANNIYAKARTRPCGLYRSEMKWVLSDLLREQEECQRLASDSRRAKQEFLQVKSAVDELLAKINYGLESN